MGRGLTALAGAAVGAGIGILVGIATEPYSEYTNDAYREGASFGFVLRYVTLGLVGALLIRALARRWKPPVAGLGLAVVLGLAIVPPLLDRGDEAGDGGRGGSSQLRTDFVAGCIEGAERQLAGTREAAAIDLDRYCSCIYARITAGPDEAAAEVEAAMIELRSGAPSPALTRTVRRCARDAAR